MNEYAYTQRHMGTNVTLSFVCPSKSQADTIAEHVFSIIHDYELKFSRFLPNSELTILNQVGTHHVSDEFIAVLKCSLSLARLTQGNFNPLVQVARLGYTRTFDTLTTEHVTIEPVDTRYSTDLDLCHIDHDSNIVKLGTGQALDFGGILKGYLSGLLADMVTETYSSCTGCIINIGGDLATRGVDEFHEPFIFFLYNPVTDVETPVAIRDKSLATSGTYARRWESSAGVQHHIVDSLTHKNPTIAIPEVSVLAEDGAMTEALTKLFLTRGVEEAVRIAPPHVHDYQYFIVSNSGEITSTIL